MRLHDGKYEVCVERVEKLDSNTLGEYDLVVNVREGADVGPDFECPSSLERVVDLRLVEFAREEERDGCS